MSASNATAQHVRQLWLAGSDPDAIARAFGTHRAAVAAYLQQLSDEELLAGLRTHLDALIAARAATKLGNRRPGGKA
jgi:hypothetical protein